MSKLEKAILMLCFISAMIMVGMTIEKAKTYLQEKELNKKDMYLIIRQDDSLKATSNNLNKARELSDEQDSIWLQEHDGEMIEIY